MYVLLTQTFILYNVKWLRRPQTTVEVCLSIPWLLTEGGSVRVLFPKTLDLGRFIPLYGRDIPSKKSGVL